MTRHFSRLNSTSVRLLRASRASLARPNSTFFPLLPPQLRAILSSAFAEEQERACRRKIEGRVPKNSSKTFETTRQVVRSRERAPPAVDECLGTTLVDPSSASPDGLFRRPSPGIHEGKPHDARRSQNRSPVDARDARIFAERGFRQQQRERRCRDFFHTCAFGDDRDLGARGSGTHQPA